MSAAEKLLARLDGVQGGSGKWRARCPAHKSRGLSLAVADRDGSTLLHCHAGCDVGSVLAAVGLGFRDLYDAPLDSDRKPTRAEWHLQDALSAIAFEARVILIAANDLATGVALCQEDVRRVAQAAGRIAAAHRRLYGCG